MTESALTALHKLSAALGGASVDTKTFASLPHVMAGLVPVYCHGRPETGPLHYCTTGCHDLGAADQVTAVAGIVRRMRTEAARPAL